jgi:hypothetical protein
MARSNNSAKFAGAYTNPNRKRGAAKSPFFPRLRVGLMWQTIGTGHKRLTSVNSTSGTDFPNL